MTKGGVRVEEEQEPSVKIGMKEVYDEVIATRLAVTNITPRLERVEKQITKLWGAFGMVALAFLGAWLSKHIG